MSTVKFKGSPVNLVGGLPSEGAYAPSFTLAAQDLSDITLES